MTEVLVVGAGPTGLTTACLLRRHGVDVRIIDRLREPAPLAKAMVLWSRSLEVLAELGISDEARKEGVELAAARYLDGDRELASVPTNTVPGTRHQPVILPQDILERLLRMRLAELGVAVEWGTEVAAITQRAGDTYTPGGVTARLADGRTIHARWAVGCDGVRSAVRTGAGIDWAAGRAYEEVFQLGDVTAETGLDRTQVHHFLGRRGVSVAIPMPADRWRIVGYFDGEDPHGTPDAAALQRLLTGCGHHGTRVGEVHWAGTFRVVRRLARTFRAGRMFVAGDAAHAHSPAGGQGLNTGIQDAHNLAWKLALVVRGLAGAALLDSYTAERRPVARAILAGTQAQDRLLFGARGNATRAVRDRALGFLEDSGLFERRLVPDLAQLLVSYRRSPATAGSAPRHATYRPGRRLPDVDLVPAGGGEPTDLRTACAATAITLVAVPGRAGADAGDPDLAAVLDRYPDAVRLYRLTGPLPHESTVDGYLLGVRPDGHLGYRGPSRTTPELKNWLYEQLCLLPHPARTRTVHSGQPSPIGA